MKLQLYQWLFLASKSSAKIQINVKSVEKTTTPGPGKNKIWLKNDQNENADKFSFSNGKSNNNGLDQPKLSKGKWNSNKQNSLGNGADLDEKPSKSDKWNLYRDDGDDYFYWDSINNHVEKDKKKTQRKVSHRSIFTYAFPSDILRNHDRIHH